MMMQHAVAQGRGMELQLMKSLNFEFLREDYPVSRRAQEPERHMPIPTDSAAVKLRTFISD